MHCTNFLLNWHTLLEELEPVDTLTYSTRIGICGHNTNAYVYRSACHHVVMLCLKSYYRGLRKRGSTLWLYQARRPTPYASVTPHTGLEN